MRTWDNHNCVFTLPYTETDTETNKLRKNPMTVCLDVCLCAVWTFPHNSIQPIFIGLTVGQCELTISLQWSFFAPFNSADWCCRRTSGRRTPSRTSVVYAVSAAGRRATWTCTRGCTSVRTTREQRTSSTKTKVCFCVMGSFILARKIRVTRKHYSRMRTAFFCGTAGATVPLTLWEGTTPFPETEWYTPVKTLPSHNFVCWW